MWATPRSATLPSDGWALAAGPTLCSLCPVCTHFSYHCSLSPLSLASPAVAGFSLAWPCLGGHPAGLALCLWEQGSVTGGLLRPPLGQIPIWASPQMLGPCPSSPHSCPQHTHYWVEAASTMRPALPSASHTLEINMKVPVAPSCRCQAPTPCLGTLASSHLPFHPGKAPQQPPTPSS